MAAFLLFLQKVIKNFEEIKMIVNLKSLEGNLCNLQENHGLRRSTIWLQAEVCSSSGYGFRNLVTSKPQN